MHEELTRQEQKVFDLLLTGAIPKDIANELNISHNTVLNHQRSIYRKLGIHSIKELLVKYMPAKESADNPTHKPVDLPIRKPFPLKIVVPAAAVILALVIPLSVVALRPSLDPQAQFVFTFIREEDNPYWKTFITPDTFFYKND